MVLWDRQLGAVVDCIYYFSELVIIDILNYSFIFIFARAKMFSLEPLVDFPNPNSMPKVNPS